MLKGFRLLRVDLVSKRKKKCHRDRLHVHLQKQLIFTSKSENQIHTSIGIMQEYAMTKPKKVTKSRKNFSPLLEVQSKNYVSVFWGVHFMRGAEVADTYLLLSESMRVG